MIILNSDNQVIRLR